MAYILVSPWPKANYVQSESELALILDFGPQYEGS